MATNFVKRRSQWTSSEKNSAYSVNIRKRALGATLDANGNLSIYRPASGGGLGLHIEQEGTAACLLLTGGDLAATDIGRTKTFILGAAGSGAVIISGNWQGSDTLMDIQNANTALTLVWNGDSWIAEASAGVAFS